MLNLNKIYFNISSISSIVNILLISFLIILNLCLFKNLTIKT